MTLYINGYKNTNFQKFVDFADTKVRIRKGNTIARMDDIATGLGGHVITAHTEDGVGGLSAFFRSKAKERINNATRENFKQSIISLFGGESKIPESVKTAMKLGDYGQGKPLTAHRIMVVKTAIDNVKTRFDTAFKTIQTNAKFAYEKAGEAGKTMMDDRIRNIIESCVDNPDLLDIVVTNINSFLVGGNSKLRDEKSINDKINELKANFAELDELTKKKPSVRELGKELMVGMRGASLPKGLIGKMMEVTKSVPIKALTNLSASSSANSIHKAVKQFLNNINFVMNESDAENLVDGAYEKDSCRTFAMQLILERCGKSAARKIHDALGTDTAAKLLTLYEKIGDGHFTQDNLSKGLISATKELAPSYIYYLRQLKLMAATSCGIAVDDFALLEGYGESFDLDEIKSGAILDQIIQAGRDLLDVQLKDYLDKTVNGKGKYVPVIQDIIKKRLGPEAFEPKEIMRNDTRQIAKNMLNQTLVDECKRFAEGDLENIQFYKDLTRNGMIVKLPGDKTLSNDFATACDQIAQFVTGKEDATYAGLDSKAKAKAHIVMSLLCQDSIKAASETYLLALDPKKHDKGFTIFAEQDKTKREFSLEWTKTGGLFVNFKDNQNIKGLSFNDISNNFLLTDIGQGSSYSGTFSLQIRPQEFDRLAEVDYTQFDPKEAEKVSQSSDEDPYQNTVNSFAPQFKFDPLQVSCNTTFSIKIN